ncbi:olfactomedin-like [Nerophis lumbriciformis]|uniref:olfactomedin-like n=1 Tax=Nerophis lumbriciformis TaxID=546530 RepID=UPI002ADFE243|nr:olfactomedin-like [Nerophis lumbriciformis]
MKDMMDSFTPRYFNMLLVLLMLSSTVDCQVQQVSGHMSNGSCACQVNTNMWLFPTVKYEATQQKVESCEDSLTALQKQVNLSHQRLPEIQSLMDNITARLEPYDYLNYRGLYASLHLRPLTQDLSKLENDINAMSIQMDNDQTKKLSKEVTKLRKDVDRIQMSDSNNVKTVRERLRKLKNSAVSCLSIPKDFRGTHRYCLNGLITNISQPVTTKISPYGKTVISGSWGQQTQRDSEGLNTAIWVQPLVHNHISGNTLRVYQSYEDFMASTNHKDYVFAPNNVHANSIEGPSAVLHGEALYYHCYQSADVCRYDLNSNEVARVELPGIKAGLNKKFPYCYYDCRASSDVDVEVDETGLWALYATVGSHGNIVVSKLSWDDESATLNVTQTWETRLFKRAVTNAFMVCGVLYATRYLDDHQEEVFYAFDTATGKEDNTLALTLDKITNDVASLSFNPVNRRLYMYNNGYLLAYQTHF